MRNWFLRAILSEEAGSEAPSGAAPPSSEPSPTASFDDVLSTAPGFESAVTQPPPPAPAAPVPPVAAPPAPSTAVPPSAAAAPVVPPVAPSAAAPALTAPGAPSSVPAVPAVPQAAAPPAPAGPTPAQQYAASRSAAQAELARAYSQFTPEQITQLITEPHVVLPQMLAAAQLDMYDMVMRSMYAQLPQVIQATMAHNRSEESAQTEFYGMFPGIKDHPQGHDTLMRLGIAYNEANAGRQLSREQRMREIGALVCSSLGIPFGAPAAPPAAPQPQATPFLPPHVPTGVGGSAAPPPIVDKSPWGDVLDLVRRS